MIRKFQNSGKLELPESLKKAKNTFATQQQIDEANKTYQAKINAGQVQRQDGSWMTKEQYEQSKKDFKTPKKGNVDVDYSDPLTMGITAIAAPGQGLLKAATSKLSPKLNTVGKVIREGVDMIDPTSIGMGLKEIVNKPLDKLGYVTVKPKPYKDKLIKDLSDEEMEDYVTVIRPDFIKSSHPEYKESYIKELREGYNSNKKVKDSGFTDIVGGSYIRRNSPIDKAKNFIDTYPEKTKEAAKKLANDIITKNPNINITELQDRINADLIKNGFDEKDVFVNVVKHKKNPNSINVYTPNGSITLENNYYNKTRIPFLDRAIQNFFPYKNNEGLKKTYDFPVLQNQKGAAPSIHNSINSYLKENNLGNLLSGDTGHTGSGKERWDKLVNRGIAEVINKDKQLYKLKKLGGKFNKGGLFKFIK